MALLHAEGQVQVCHIYHSVGPGHWAAAIGGFLLMEQSSQKIYWKYTVLLKAYTQELNTVPSTKASHVALSNMSGERRAFSHTGW